jgi:hypothetical protein
MGAGPLQLDNAGGGVDERRDIMASDQEVPVWMNAR